MNILMLGAGRRLSLVNKITRAAEEEGTKVSIYAYEDSIYCPISKVSNVIAGRKWTDPLFKDELFSIIEKKSIDVIIPLMDGATVALSELNNKTKSFWACVSSYETCATFYDKRLSEKWFVKNGVNIPLIKDKIVFPIILKDAFGFGAKGQYFAENEIELEHILNKINYENFVIQPFIRGKEYTVDAYVSKSGEVLGCVPRTRLYVVGGEVVNSITTKNEALESECRRILSLSEFRGPITIQAIENKDGIWFIEVNPRFGGGVILSMEAGADYAKLLIREALGKPVEKVNWRDKLLMTRSYQETFHEEVML